MSELITFFGDSINKLSAVVAVFFGGGVLSWAVTGTEGGGVFAGSFGLFWDEFWWFCWFRVGYVLGWGCPGCETFEVGCVTLWFGGFEDGFLGALGTRFDWTFPLACLTMSAFLNFSMLNSLLWWFYLNLRILTKMDPLICGTLAPKLLMSIHAVTFSLPSGISDLNLKW